VPRLLLVIPFIVLFAGVLVGGHWYLAQRLVLDAGLSPGLERGLVWAIVACAATLILQPIGERTLKPPLSRVIAWPASLWMGLFFYLFLLAAFSDGLLFLGSLFGAETVQAAEAGTQAPAGGLGGVRAAAVAVLALAFVALGMRGWRGGPVLAPVEIFLPRWPAALDGFRIVQISDIHIGPLLDRRFAAELTERVNALDPDLVAVTGDLVDGSVSKLRDEVEPFGGLRARHGVFFVTGNHDHYSGADGWSARMQELGMRVLRNERVTVQCEGGAFELAGVDDHRSGYETFGGEDLDKALAGLSGELPVVLLAHDPSTFKKACRMGIDLQLSGHTHGGQIWPFEYFVRLAIPFVAGLYQRGDAQVYVSRGTGFWGPPMRLGAPAEITEIRIRSGSRPGPEPGGLQSNHDPNPNPNRNTSPGESR
jgi:predicted MPP superfamily phosphohydrolase